MHRWWYSPLAVSLAVVSKYPLEWMRGVVTLTVSSRVGLIILLCSLFRFRLASISFSRGTTTTSKPSARMCVLSSAVYLYISAHAFNAFKYENKIEPRLLRSGGGGQGSCGQRNKREARLITYCKPKPRQGKNLPIPRGVYLDKL